jgi:hypothetical protein
MRTKLFILLALFVAFSSASFAADSMPHTLQVTLDENRNITVSNFPETLALKRADPATPANWVDTSAGNESSLTVDHDIGIPQKVTVVAALTSGDWTDRYLTVTAVAGANPFTLLPTPPVFAAETTLIDPTGSLGSVDLITNIHATPVGVPADVVITYSAVAGLSSVAGDCTSIITYTLMDD